MSRRDARTALGGAVLVLALGACSPLPAGGEPSPEATSASSSEAGTGAPEIPVGPVEELVDAVAPGPFDEAVAAQDARREAAIAECMRAEGFEYATSEAYAGTSVADLDVKPGTPEFARQHGYGITTDPWGAQDEPAVAYVDPNQAALDAMSEAERAAWDRALLGEMADPGTDAAWTSENSGCTGRATADAVDPTALEGFAGLQEEIEHLWEQVEADPRVVELSASWAACMAGSGYSFERPVDAEDSITAAHRAIFDELYGDAGPVGDEASAEDLARQAEIEAEAEPRVAALREIELATAVADVACRAEADLDRRHAEVSVELQEAFYEAHRDELEAWRDAAVDGRR